eukprot:COSAG06_NODE_20226_length_803_cov_2.079545_1_plen_114_part_10
MPNAQRKDFGRLTVDVCCKFSGKAITANAKDGYHLTYIAEHRNSIRSDKFVVAAQKRGEFGPGMIVGRLKGQDAGTDIEDSTITAEQAAGASRGGFGPGMVVGRVTGQDKGTLI